MPLFLNRQLLLPIIPLFRQSASGRLSGKLTDNQSSQALASNGDAQGTAAAPVQSSLFPQGFFPPSAASAGFYAEFASLIFSNRIL
jgi:hypothetical protein